MFKEYPMKPFPRVTNPRVNLGAACAVVLVAGTLAASGVLAAGDRPTREARPRWETKHTEQRRTATGRERTTIWTGTNGRTASREAVVSHDPSTGTHTREVTLTGPGGGTATRTDTTRKTEDGYTRNSVITGPGGQTATRDATVSFDGEAGTRTREVTTTGPNGQTRTVSDVTTKTDDDFERQIVTTNPNGSTVTRQVTRNRDAEAGTWTREVTVDRDPAEPVDVP
jgi:hypothetical protein